MYILEHRDGEWAEWNRESSMSSLSDVWARIYYIERNMDGGRERVLKVARTCGEETVESLYEGAFSGAVEWLLLMAKDSRRVGFKRRFERAVEH